MSIEDRAQEQEALEWASINNRKPTIPTYEPDHPLYGPQNCEGCEATMPALRRSHGWLLCTSCQEDAELTAGQAARRRR